MRAPANSPVVPFTHAQYRRLLARAQKVLRVDFGWTPHSPRAGFPSEAIQDGVPFQEVQEAGRWLVDSSLRMYIGLVQTAQLAVEVQARGLLSADEFVALDFFRFFPGLAADCREVRDGQSRDDEGAGRASLPKVESGAWPETGRLPDADEASEGEDGPAGQHPTTAASFRTTGEPEPASTSRGRGQAKGGRGQGTPQICKSTCQMTKYSVGIQLRWCS